MMTRRFLLAAAAVTSAASALPSISAVAAEVTPVVPRLPAYVVGTPDVFNWQIVRANDIDAAIREIAISNAGGDCSGCEDSNCDFCCEMRKLEALRVTHMDEIDNPTPADWIRADCGHCCSRCGYETFPQEGGQAVGDEAVCEECMTMQDWLIADPEHHAELLAEKLAEEAEA